MTRAVLWLIDYFVPVAIHIHESPDINRVEYVSMRRPWSER